jgi:HK97 family phage portal protein
MAEDARRMPSREPEYRNLILNQRVEMNAPFVSRSVWASCGGDVIESFDGRPAFIGLDLSSVSDLTAKVIISPVDRLWHVKPTFWLPARKACGRNPAPIACPTTRGPSRGSCGPRLVGRSNTNSSRRTSPRTAGGWTSARSRSTAGALSTYWIQQLVALVTPARVRSTGPLSARAAGMAVTAETALGHATVWGCVNAITGAIAPLEWCEIRGKADGSREEINTNINWLLNKQANPEMTAFTWRETALAQAMMGGNHYSEIERDTMGRPLWLWPTKPESTRPDRDASGKLIYRVWQETGGEVVIPAANMLHLKGLGWDGIVGLSVIAMARRSIGMGLAMDEYGANFYQNGTHVGLIFEHPKTLTEGAQDRLKKSLQDNYTGAGHAFKTMVTEEGMKLSKATMSMVDAQFIESRRATATDICKWFRVPPHKVAELDRSTNNNIEHQSIEFVQDAIVPWCRRLEQEVDIKLYGRAAQRSTYTKIDTDPLLRGDIKSMYEAYSKALGGAAFLCADDVREFMEMNPLPDKKGQIFLQPMNYVEAGTQPAPTAAPAAPAEPAPTAPEPVQPDNVIRREALAWKRAQKEQANG